MSIPCLKFMVMVYVSVFLLLGGYIYHYDMNYFSLTFPYSLVIGVVLFALLGVGGALLFLRKAWGMTPACFFLCAGRGDIAAAPFFILVPSGACLPSGEWPACLAVGLFTLSYCNIGSCSTCVLRLSIRWY